jgi:hypothetical protein
MTAKQGLIGLAKKVVKTKGPSKTHHVKRKAERIKTYSIELIFDFIRKNPDEMYYVDEDGNKCKLRRAKVFFEHGLQCIEPGCPLKGLFFALEKWPMGDLHFDLFALDEYGDEVLMTIDHVIPKSKGGKDEMSNYQPMCKVCNELKSDTI